VSILRHAASGSSPQNLALSIQPCDTLLDGALSTSDKLKTRIGLIWAKSNRKGDRPLGELPAAAYSRIVSQDPSTPRHAFVVGAKDPRGASVAMTASTEVGEPCFLRASVSRFLFAYIRENPR